MTPERQHTLLQVVVVVVVLLVGIFVGIFVGRHTVDISPHVAVSTSEGGESAWIVQGDQILVCIGIVSEEGVYCMERRPQPPR